MSLCESLESRRLFAAYRHAEVVLDDGGKVTADFNRNSRGHTITVSRFDAGGTRDASFGTNGVATISDVLLFSDPQVSFNVTVDHTGRVLVLSQTQLFRLKANGGRDKTLDADGRVDVPVVRTTASIDVDARNRPVIAGTSTGKTGDRGTVLRLGERGVLDRSFGSGGAFKRAVPQDRKLQIPGDSTGIGVKVLDDGDIVGVAVFKFETTQDRRRGYTEIGADTFRLDATGTLDAGYGKNGASGYRNVFSAGESRIESLFRMNDDGSVELASYYDPDLEGGTTIVRLIDKDGVVQPAA